MLIIVSVRTRVGGLISSYASLFRSSANWISARLNIAPGATQHREHRSGELGGALEVEDAEVSADVPVRHALVGLVRVRVVADDPHDRVVLGAGAVGRLVGRQVRRVEQDEVELGRDVRNERFQLALGFSEGTALRLHRFRACDVAGLAERADLARQGLDPIAHVIALCDGVAFAAGRARWPGRCRRDRPTDGRARL